MRRIFILLLFPALLLIPPASAEWIGTGGPIGGLGYDVRIDPNTKSTMYVTDNFAGVLKSTDSGINWSAKNSGITVKGGDSGDAFNIFSLTIDPNDSSIIWTGTNGGTFGIFKSTNAGATWTEKSTGLVDPGNGLVFRGFTVLTGNSNVVYAMAEASTAVQGREFDKTQGKLYKTTDGGATWTLLYTNENLFRYLIIDPNNSSILYLSTGIFDREPNNYDCSTAVAGGGVGVLKSINGGTSWSAINSGLTDLYIGSLRMHPTDSSILFVATGNNACSGQSENNITSGLFKTTDSGATWTKVISNEIMTTVNFAPSDPNVIYAGSAIAFHKSSDGGTSWTTYSKTGINEWGPDGVRAGVPIDVVIDPDDSNILFANNYGGGVFKSSDGAKTWEMKSRGYSSSTIHQVAIAPSDPSIVYAIGRSGPYKSVNYGLDWVGISTGDANFPEWYGLAVHPTDASLVVIADEHNGVILKSTNGGTSFLKVLTQPNANAGTVSLRQGFKAIAFAPSDGTIIYAGLARERNNISTVNVPTGSVFYKSTDSGSTFSSTGATLDGKNIYQIVIDKTDKNLLWAATSNGIYKSIDGAVSWSQLAGTSTKDIWSIAVSGSKMISGEKDVGIRTSSDGGATWSAIQNTGISGTPFIRALSYDPSDSTSATIYAGDLYTGSYKSTDGGVNWSAFDNSTLAYKAITSLSIASTSGGTIIYSGTSGGGVFRDGGPSAVATPSSKDFGSVASASSSSASTVTIYNTRATAVTVSAVTVSGTDSGEFKTSSDTCTGTNLAKDASCTVAVTFSPASSGSKTASLSVSSGDAYRTSFTVALTGTATSASSATPTSSSGGGGGGTSTIEFLLLALIAMMLKRKWKSGKLS